jgi:hypothetical protein
MQSTIDWHQISMAYLETNFGDTRSALRLLLQTIEEINEDDNILNRKVLIPSHKQLKSLIMDSLSKT